MPVVAPRALQQAQQRFNMTTIYMRLRKFPPVLLWRVTVHGIP
jgi:hypothetical protein